MELTQVAFYLTAESRGKGDFRGHLIHLLMQSRNSSFEGTNEEFNLLGLSVNVWTSLQVPPPHSVWMWRFN